MVGLSAGHGVKHFYQQTLLLLLPHIKETLLLSDVAAGGIIGARAAAMGAMNIPAGVLTDMFRSRIAIMLAGSMTCLAIGYAAIGLASNYWLILFAVAIAGAGTSMWHAPAFTELAVRYPERRAFAIAAHRSGGSVGDSSAPFLIGVLLGGISLAGLEWGGLGWRTVALLHVGPAVVTGVVILLRFKSAGAGAQARVRLRDYLGSARPLVPQPDRDRARLRHRAARDGAQRLRRLPRALHGRGPRLLRRDRGRAPRAADAARDPRRAAHGRGLRPHRPAAGDPLRADHDVRR